jgi:hypothetical protein
VQKFKAGSVLGTPEAGVEGENGNFVGYLGFTDAGILAENRVNGVQAILAHKQ